MNKILFLFVALVLYIPTNANSKLISDTLTFEVQRQRVNQLLDERSAKFSEYDFSLQQKTGFFGLLKSHQDFENSMQILENIILNDNKIFIETRKLLDLKDGERERFQALALEYDNQITAHMRTVSKLQKENERLHQVIKDLEKKEHTQYMIWYVIVLVLLVFGGAYLFYYRHSKNKM